MKNTLIFAALAAVTMNTQAQINQTAAHWMKSNEDIQSMADAVQRNAPVRVSDELHIVDAKVSGDLFVIHYEMQMAEAQVIAFLDTKGISLQQFKDDGEQRTMADICSLDFTMDVLDHGGRVGQAFSYKNGPIAYMAEASGAQDCE